MNKKRMLLFRIASVLLLIAISACMMVVGRGHTVYLDNKTLEYGGNSYKAPYKVTVIVHGEQAAKLYEKERGSATNIGQSFSMTLKVMQEKGGPELEYDYRIKIPYKLDGIVVNIPGLMAGLPEEAWQSEFVPITTEADDADEEIPGGDEFEMGEI